MVLSSEVQRPLIQIFPALSVTFPNVVPFHKSVTKHCMHFDLVHLIEGQWRSTHRIAWDICTTVQEFQHKNPKLGQQCCKRALNGQECDPSYNRNLGRNACCTKACLLLDD